MEDSVIAQLHGCEEVKPYLDRVKVPGDAYRYIAANFYVRRGIRMN